jgi:ribosomal protein S8
MQQISSHNFLNVLKLVATNKKLFFFISFSFQIFQIIQVLKDLNFIKSYIIIKKNNKIFIKIYLSYYKQLPLFSALKLLASSSKFFFVSLKSLQLIQKKTLNSIFLLHTSRGIITHIEALKLKIGGRFLAQLSI